MGRKSSTDSVVKMQYIGPVVKKQLNGRKFDPVYIDTDDTMALQALESDIELNPDRYAVVAYLGISMIVRIKDED